METQLTRYVSPTVVFWGTDEPPKERTPPQGKKITVICCKRNRREVKLFSHTQLSVEPLLFNTFRFSFFNSLEFHFFLPFAQILLLVEGVCLMQRKVFSSVSWSVVEVTHGGATFFPRNSPPRDCGNSLQIVV